MKGETNIQKLHRSIDERIVQLLLSVIPEGWWSIRLDVLRDDASTGDFGVSLSISSGEGYHDIVLPPDELYRAVLKHLAVFEQLGKPWSALNYVVYFDDSAGSWRFTIDYSY